MLKNVSLNCDKMILWILILISAPLSLSRETQYECGAHGKFEYCIDDIPGCVLGCHCHPGYYFDTDTKICEPNIKLTQESFRRHYLSEPTRIQIPPLTPPVRDEPDVTTTSNNIIDEKVDEITKDADDLGDWLYNQFFKTIENQVLNKTKDEGVLTRRSGSNPNFDMKPSRRSHKYWKSKKKKKKKKGKKKGLRNKLLRITEDDSLFDSSSGSTSDESSSSSSTSSESSDCTREKKDDKNDHGHKKIVVFNKRPRPPLPSFIFLPNMETPFYPPIGLPPPPIMPMYPMVPVPPMMGPQPFPPYPYPAHSHDNGDEQPTTAANSISTTTEHATTATNGVAAITTDSTTTATTEAENKEENEDKHENENVTEENVENETEKVMRSQLKRNNPRNKLMQKLRDKMKRKKKMQNFFANQYQDPSPPLMNIPPGMMPNPNLMQPKAMFGDSGGLQDFKYLAQLIHRVDLNQTTPNPFINNNQISKAEANLILSRRNYHDYNNLNQQVNSVPNSPVNNNFNQPIYNIPNQFLNNFTPRNKIEQTNDTYYTNLGRQIASMIRNIDANGDREVDIEIEKSNIKPSNNPIFNENNFASRSYWERSVRSPLKHLNSYKNEIDHLKQSNEYLFNLENQVEIAASTVPTLDLHELENIINKMENAKSKLTRKNYNPINTESSKTSFNVNLLPGNDRQYYSYEKDSRTSQTKQAYKYQPQINYNFNLNRLSARSLLGPEFNGILLGDVRRVSPNTVEMKNQTVFEKFIIPEMLTTTKPNANIVPNNIPKMSNNFHLIRNINSTAIQESANKTNPRYSHINPMLYNHKNINVHPNNKNQYLYEKSALPIQFPTSANHFKPYGKLIKPSSYFHHELHHFDYFDK